MSSASMLKIVKAALTSDPIPLGKLAVKLGKTEWIVRIALNDLADLGIAEQVRMPPLTPAQRRKLLHKPCAFGWKLVSK